MHRGQWLDSPNAVNGSRSPFKFWQAPGCLIHQYKPKEIASCVSNKKILFAGDSTVRQVYWATARKLNKTLATELETAMYDLAKHEDIKHQDQMFDAGGVKLEFRWDPYLNLSTTFDELKAYKEASAGQGAPGTGPALTLLGSGAWWARWYDAGHAVAGIQPSVKNVMEQISPAVDLNALAAAKHDVGDQVFFQPISTLR